MIRVRQRVGVRGGQHHVRQRAVHSIVPTEGRLVAQDGQKREKLSTPSSKLTTESCTGAGRTARGKHMNLLPGSLPLEAKRQGDISEGHVTERD